MVRDGCQLRGCFKPTRESSNALQERVAKFQMAYVAQAFRPAKHAWISLPAALESKIPLDMASPDTLRIRVLTAVGQPVPGATVKVVFRRGVEWRVEKPPAPAPLSHAIPANFVQIEVDASAPGYVDERGILTFGVSQQRWQSTNASWSVKEANTIADLDVFIGRIWFSPIVSLPKDHKVKTPFNPGGVLVDQTGYRTFGVPDETCRALRQPAIGNPDAPSRWDRFQWSEEKVKLANGGNWLLLEYGDPSGRADAWRQLLGVWAPHSFSGTTPHVVVQITPNTREPYYPADTVPFTGLYPYGCVPGATPPDKETGTLPLELARQAYVELPANRCFGQYKIVYQLYASRPDLFNGPNGPIVITLSPALIAKKGALRDPFTNREAMGRLIAEVLRFLWSRLLTLPQSLGSVRLRFRPPHVTVWGDRPATAPNGFPRSCLTTVVTHSAGVVPLMALAGHAPGAKVPAPFDAALFGGANGYCEQSWQHLWALDAISEGGIGSPTAGSTAVKAWLTWLKGGDQRRFVGFYTPSGLGDAVAPELIRLAAPAKRGKAGWIQEGFSGRVSWLQVSYTYLRVPDPGAPEPDNPKSANLKDVRPAFGKDGEDPNATHNKAYEFAVAYAARRRRD